MTTLLVDFSPIWTRFVFNGRKQYINDGGKKNSDGFYDFNEFKDIVIFNTIEEITSFKYKFKVQEIVLAFDTKENGKYWRHDIWSGYKYGRRKDADIDWKVIQQVQNELKKIFDTLTSWKVVSVPRAEGDDVIFVLSKFLGKTNNIIVHTVDHDLSQCQELADNVMVFETKNTCNTKQDAFVCKMTPEEIKELQFNHVVFGDSGDYIKHIKSWSRMSDKFKELYPSKTALDMYPKRHELDVAFKKKYEVSAYKHPRFGAKTFAKSSDTLEDILDSNPIHRMNYDLNRKLVLPYYIPKNIEDNIINAYLNAKSERDIARLMKYFTENGMFELQGKIGLL
jgi:hypothetical protein